MASTLSNVITKVSADTTNFEQGMKRARKQSKQFGDASKQVNQQMRFMRGGLGQVGHQVQDIAVQLQMGQNAMLVFGQQGSQIASLFGPGGAMIGAVLAAGAAISMSLMPSLFGATEAAKELKEANKGLIDNFDGLGKAQQAYAKILATEKLNEYTSELERLNKVSRDRLTITETGGFFDRFFAKKGELESIEDYNKRIKKLDNDIEFYTEAKKELKEQIDGTTSAFKRQEASLQKQIDTFGKSAHAIRVYGIEADLAAKKIEKGEADKLKAQSLTLDTLEKNAERQKELDADRKKAQQDAAKEANKVLKDQEKTAQRFADTIGDGFTRAITGAMSFKDAIKNVAKSVVDDLIKMIVKKQITDQIFGALMNTSFFGGGSPADSAGMTDFSPGFQPEMIAEGGGFTGYGARSGGVDGKGGFPAILHPNETVIDHTKNNAPDFNQIKSLTDNFNPSFERVESLTDNFDPNFGRVKSLLDNFDPNFDKVKSLLNNFDPSFDRVKSLLDNFNPNFDRVKSLTDNIKPSFKVSMEGGGFTGHGARSGGLDGKGGFPAILHPNETVIDHTKKKLSSFDGGGYTGGAMPVSSNSVTNNIDNSTSNENNEQQVIVNQTINITTGVQQTVRAEIQNLMPQIQEAAKAAVADSRARGGSYSKALVGR